MVLIYVKCTAEPSLHAQTDGLTKIITAAAIPHSQISPLPACPLLDRFRACIGIKWVSVLRARVWFGPQRSKSRGFNWCRWRRSSVELAFRHRSRHRLSDFSGGGQNKAPKNEPKPLAYRKPTEEHRHCKHGHRDSHDCCHRRTRHGRHDPCGCRPDYRHVSAPKLPTKTRASGINLPAQHGQ